MYHKTLLLGFALLLAAMPANAGNGGSKYNIGLTGTDCEVSKVIVTDLSGACDAISVDFQKALKLSSTPQTFTVTAPKKAFRNGFSVKAFDSKGNAVGFATCTEAAKDVTLDLPANGEPSLVAARGYYKDIFQDAGCALTSYLTLPAASYLGLSYDTMGTTYETCHKYTEEDSVYQHAIVCGTEYDLNGALLYPDNEPRYRMMYHNGGLAASHGRTLTSEGRRNYKTFIANGGSYVGSCAGAYITSVGTTKFWKTYLGLIPLTVRGTGYSNGETGMFIMEDSPLLKYQDFGKDMYVDSVHHEGGCYLPDENVIEDVEILARYDKPDLKLHNHISVWAYKPDAVRGRVIACGSHPEQVKDGERRDFMASMLQYALDGAGAVGLKGILENGNPRVMDCLSSAGKPENARIGDKQYHHYRLFIPEGARDIKISVVGDGIHNLELAMSKDGFAWRSDARYLLSQKGSDKELTFKKLEPGVWYVSVYCPDTVSVSFDYKKFEYSGDITVLNGVPYTISASWK